MLCYYFYLKNNFKYDFNLCRMSNTHIGSTKILFVFHTLKLKFLFGSLSLHDILRVHIY